MLGFRLQLPVHVSLPKGTAWSVPNSMRSAHDNWGRWQMRSKAVVAFCVWMIIPLYSTCNSAAGQNAITLKGEASWLVPAMANQEQ